MNRSWRAQQDGTPQQPGFDFSFKKFLDKNEKAKKKNQKSPKNKLYLKYAEVRKTCFIGLDLRTRIGN